MDVETVVTTITNDSVKARTAECIELSKFYFLNRGEIFYWSIPSGDGKARTRSIQCSRFLTDSVAKYQVFIDSDILFKPEDLMRLIEDLKAGYDLVAGLFAVRGGTQPSSYAYDAKYNIDGKLHEFEYLSTGFWGCTRNCLEKIRDGIPLPFLHPRDLKFWPFFEERMLPDREAEAIFLSEDYDFCEKARRVGIKAFIDSSIQLGHIGEYTYTLQDVLNHQEGGCPPQVLPYVRGAGTGASLPRAHHCEDDA